VTTYSHLVYVSETIIRAYEVVLEAGDERAPFSDIRRAETQAERLYRAEARTLGNPIKTSTIRWSCAIRVEDPTNG